MTTAHTPTPGTPTQVAHPTRTTVRTIVQQLLGWVLAAGVVLPLILTIVQEELGHLIRDDVMGWLVAAVGVAVAISAAVTRIMAIPRVEEWLSRHLPGLATGVHLEAARTLGPVDRSSLEHLRGVLADIDNDDPAIAALDKILSDSA